MQFRYENSNARYIYGIDRFGGLFITIEKDERLQNFTQFYPFESRFSYSLVNENVPAADLKEIGKTPIGEYKVCFELATSEEYKGELKKELVLHYLGEHDFVVKTWGELFDLMAYFNKDIFFFEMTLINQDGTSPFGHYITWINECA
ncbi:hypothetical protein [Lysinibacillus sphaericus]|uniref:hypothetical protein n=1 Tax=Lysinibacillus sphaericus TaxID=1421 RepID=UPI000C1A0F74|nr:hypothetical protein [Lysinibacillus sphaericus]PIJ98191.1 hypothetical protein CTN02_10645 [Lysinibacillus sphaericus]